MVDITLSIFNHHDKRYEHCIKEIKKYATEKLRNEIEKLKKEFSEYSEIEILDFEPENINYVQKSPEKSLCEDEYKFYVLVKGLLHRLDYSSSADVPIEIESCCPISKKVEIYIKNNLKSDLNEPQKFTMNNKDNNVVLVSSTGYGKTEAALLWADKDKTFFTLPIRTSINSIYKRISEFMNYKQCGIMHSTSLEFLYKETNSLEASEYIYRLSKTLSYPLIVSTIDQLFTFPFKHFGYEKYLSTLSYSKVIIDEIQAYSPKIAAALLVGIKQITEFGGKFLLMTATLPSLYIEYLNEKKINFQIERFYTNKKRHIISIQSKDIIDDVDKILYLSDKNSVLVITNTVKKSKELYLKIKEKTENVELLNSLFTFGDRAEKEKMIMEKKERKIWISTQIVEASLDVDFDFLFTELSTADSLFQRMGRCYRKREYRLNEPNVYIYTQNPSGVGLVYDKDIHELTLRYITEFDGKLITEEEKDDIVNKIYSKENLINKKYYSTFERAIGFLESIQPGEVDKEEAKEILREMRNITVVPYQLYKRNRELFEKYSNTFDKEERIKLYMKLRDFMIDVPLYKIKEKFEKLTEIENVYLACFDYNSDVGLDLNQKTVGDLYQFI
ncbi:MAG: CRISPR-associated helicase Cas3' [Fervidobacterium sp.]